MEINTNSFLKKLFSPKYFPPFITILLLVVGTFTVLSLVKDQTITIEKEQVVIRMKPATNAEGIGTADVGQKYIVLSESNGWYKIRINARDEGWIPQWLITNDTLVNDQSLAAHILVETPIYSSPNESSQIIANAEPSSYIFVRNEENGWSQVEIEGQYGYLKTVLVSLIHTKDIPYTDLAKMDMPYDPEALKKAKEEAEKIVVVRYTGEPFFSTPNTAGEQLYSVAYGQKFKYIEEVEGTNGVLFMHVEDSEGLQGYVESRISAMESDSIAHVEKKTANNINEAVIMIDPGHGGEDVGAISADGSIYEKNIALSTSLKLKDYLEQAGATVVMTRNDDSSIDLIPRTELSNHQQVDAFISIHFDAVATPEWSGTTSYYFHENDFDLAKQINNALTVLDLPNNGTLFGNYSVLRENTRQSALIELGYMSNASDLEKMQTDKYQSQVAELIASALTNYFNN